MLRHVCVCFAVVCAITMRRIVLGWLCNPSIPQPTDKHSCELHYCVRPLQEDSCWSVVWRSLGPCTFLATVKLETQPLLLGNAIFVDALEIEVTTGILPTYQLETYHAIKRRLFASVASTPFNVLSSRPSTFPSAVDLVSSSGRAC